MASNYHGRIEPGRPKPSHKPEFADVVPELLYELGEVFFPIPAGKKGWNYPHHLETHRYHPRDKEFNAYLEAGWSYGIACAGNLAVVDIDERGYVEEVMDQLPATAYQWSGSREGVHLFYRYTGELNQTNLYSDLLSEKIHIGEIRCNEHAFVVGPGSRHPSGNKYGPLKNDQITEVKSSTLKKLAMEYSGPDGEDISSPNVSGSDYRRDDDETTASTGRGKLPKLYRLTADDVLPFLGTEERIAHPVHGSTTYQETDGRTGNFMKNEGGDTFICWRCQRGGGPGCALNGAQFLACEGLKTVGRSSDRVCEKVRDRWSFDTKLHYYAWYEAYNNSLLSSDDVCYSVLHGYACHRGIIDLEDDLVGDLYHQVKEGFHYERSNGRLEP